MSAGQLGANGRCVRLDPRVELRARAVLEQLHLVALVAVEHEGGQQAADIRPDDPCRADVVTLGMRLLAEDDDVVPRAAPLPREGARVDVRAGAAEEIAVPEQDAHGRHLASAELVAQLHCGAMTTIFVRGRSATPQRERRASTSSAVAGWQLHWCDEADVRRGDRVVEIGAGTGVLTRALAERRRGRDRSRARRDGSRRNCVSCTHCGT